MRNKRDVFQREEGEEMMHGSISHALGNPKRNEQKDDLDDEMKRRKRGKRKRL